MRVFIAGPYTLGDVAANVAQAIEAGHAVMDKVRQLLREGK